MNPFERATTELGAAMSRVDTHLTVAINELTAGQEDSAFTTAVAAAATEDDHFPGLTRSEFLAANYPEAHAQVLARAKELQQAAFEQEDRERRTGRWRRVARALLEGVSTLGGGLATTGQGIADIPSRSSDLWK